MADNSSKATPSVLRCRQIAQHIKSSHKCDCQKFLQRKSRVHLINLSTRRNENLEICLALSHLKQGEKVGNWRITSRSASEIEQVFGTSKFEICSDMLKRIKYHLNKPTKKNHCLTDCCVARTEGQYDNAISAAS